MTGLPHARHWIGGEWIDAAKPTESMDPATGKPIGTCTEAGEAEVAKAAAAALNALRNTVWRDDRRFRAKVLNEMANRFEARTNDLVAVISLANGEIRGEARFKIISLTGGPNTGQAIMAAGAPNMKRFDDELGGKTPIVMFDNADLDMALPMVAKALTTFAGQFCMTGSRLLVQRGIFDIVRERLGQRLAAVKAGSAADPASKMGPMINMANVRRVDGLVETAIAAGAKMVVQGGPFAEGPLAQGAFYRPTLLEIDNHRLPIAQDETLGPVLVMQGFETEQGAVTLANDSEHGLAASIWSTNVERPLLWTGPRVSPCRSTQGRCGSTLRPSCTPRPRRAASSRAAWAA